MPVSIANLGVGAGRSSVASAAWSSRRREVLRSSVACCSIRDAPLVSVHGRRAGRVQLMAGGLSSQRDSGKGVMCGWVSMSSWPDMVGPPCPKDGAALRPASMRLRLFLFAAPDSGTAFAVTHLLRVRLCRSSSQIAPRRARPEQQGTFMTALPEPLRERCLHPQRPYISALCGIRSDSRYAERQPGAARSAALSVSVGHRSPT